MTISPTVNGFLKGLLLVVVGTVAAYLSDATHLTGVLPTVLIPLVIAIASAVESGIKAKSGAGLFGAVRVR